MTLPSTGAQQPSHGRSRGERAKIILRGFGALLALPGVLLFVSMCSVGSTDTGWAAMGGAYGAALLLVAVPAFLASSGATSPKRPAQIAAFAISLGYLLVFGFLFLRGVVYALEKPIGTAGFWALLLASAIALAPLAATALLATVVAAGDEYGQWRRPSR